MGRKKNDDIRAKIDPVEFEHNINGVKTVSNPNGMSEDVPSKTDLLVIGGLGQLIYGKPYTTPMNMTAYIGYKDSLFSMVKEISDNIKNKVTNNVSRYVTQTHVDVTDNAKKEGNKEGRLTLYEITADTNKAIREGFNGVQTSIGLLMENIQPPTGNGLLDILSGKDGIKDILNGILSKIHIPSVKEENKETDRNIVNVVTGDKDKTDITKETKTGSGNGEVNTVVTVSVNDIETMAMNKLSEMLGTKAKAKGIVDELKITVDGRMDLKPLVDMMRMAADRGAAPINTIIENIGKLKGIFNALSLMKTDLDTKKVNAAVGLLGNLTHTFEKLDQASEFNEKPMLKLMKFIQDDFSAFINNLSGKFKDTDNVSVQSAAAVKSAMDMFNGIAKLGKFKDNEIEAAVGNILTLSDSLEEIYDNLSGILPKLTKLLGDIKPDKKTDWSGELSRLSDAMQKVARMETVLGMAKPFIKPAGFVIEQLAGQADMIKKALTAFDGIDPKKLDSLADMMKDLAKLVAVSAGVLVAGALAMRIVKVKDILTFTAILGLFVIGITGVLMLVADKVDKTTEIAEGFSKLVAVSAMSLIIGGLAMRIVKKGDLLTFAAILGGFVLSMTLIYGLFSKTAADTKASMTDFMHLVVASAGVLILGALFVQIPGMTEGAMQFAVILGGFILAVMAIFTGYSMLAKNVKNSLSDFALLIVASAGVMMLGAFFVMIPGIVGYVIKFGALLAAFIGVITFVFAKASGGMQLARGVGKAFAEVVIVSAATMLIGGMFMMIPGMPTATMKFMALFAFYINGLIISYVALSFAMRKAKLKALEFIVLVGMTVSTLLIGALFMRIPGMATAATEFVALALGYIAGMAGIIKYLSTGFTDAQAKNSVKALTAICGVSVLIGVAFEIAADVVKRLGGWDKMAQMVTLIAVEMAYVTGMFALIKKTAKGFNRQQAANASVALAAIAGVTLVMSLSMEVLRDVTARIGSIGMLVKMSIMLGYMIAVTYGMFEGVKWLAKSMSTDKRFKEQLAEAGIALAGICGIIALMSAAFYAVSFTVKAIDKAGGNVKLLETMGVMVGTVGVIGAMVAGLAALIGGTGGVGGAAIGMAELAIAGVVAIIGEMAGVFWLIAEAEKNLVKAKSFKVEDGLRLIGGFIELGWALKPMALMGLFIIPACLSAAGLAYAISEISNTVKEVADLTIPVYENGRKTDRLRKLTNDDFTAAAANVKAIVSVLGTAILDLYADPRTQGIFSEDIWFGKTPFTMVTESCTRMGAMISSISHSVKSMAEMMIPVTDANGVLVKGKYRKMTLTDFQEASTNIGLILTTLGRGIIASYTNPKNAGMFDEDFFTGNSPYTLVTKAAGKLGGMISKIAHGVQDMASLRIPVYDASGVIVKDSYRLMKTSDFQAAADNVDVILSTLGRGVIYAYKNPKNAGMFDDSFLTTSKYAKVVNAGTKLGGMISGIAKGVQGMAELKLPLTDAAGNIIKDRYRVMNKKDFETAAWHVDVILTTLGRAVIASYKNPANAEMFDDTFLTTSKYSKVVNSATKLGGMISGIAQGVQGMAQLQLPMTDASGAVIKGRFRVMKKTDFTEAGNNVGAILTAVATGFKQAYDAAPDMFDDGDDSLFKKVSDASDSITGIISSMSKTVADVASLKIPVMENGRLSDKKYRRLTKTDFTAVGANVSALLTSMFKAVNGAYTQNAALFDDNDAIRRIGTSTGYLLTLVSNTGKAAGIFAGGRIPVAAWKNGRLSVTAGGMVPDAAAMRAVSRDMGRIFGFITDMLTYASKTDTLSDKWVINRLRNAYWTVRLFGLMTGSLTSHSAYIARVSGSDYRKAAANIRMLVADMGTVGIRNTSLLARLGDGMDFQAMMKNLSWGMDRIMTMGRKYAKFTSDYRINPLESLSAQVYRLNARMAEVRYNDAFSKEVNDVDLFARNVNSINPYQADRFIRMIQSLNQLSVRLGSLGRFTDVLADKISVVLAKLTAQLRSAQQTIKEADRLQTKRHTLIKKAQEDIKKILDEPLVVDIRQDTTSNLTMDAQGDGTSAGAGTGTAGGGYEGAADQGQASVAGRGRGRAAGSDPADLVDRIIERLRMTTLKVKRV